jgi:hypothetical protein
VEVIVDHQGEAGGLIDERRAYILDHPEMTGLEAAISETLKHPALVVKSISDEDARLYNGRWERLDRILVGSVLLGCADRTSVSVHHITIEARLI